MNEATDAVNAQASAADAGADPRLTGWLLVFVSLLALGLALVHPQLTARDLAGVLGQMVDGAVFNGWIHGSLMLSYLVLVSAFYLLSRRLGLGRPAVSLGMTAYAFGTFAMIAAAVINGFALALFASQYAGVGVGADRAAAVGAAFNLAGSISAIWAAVGAAGWAVATLAWSLRLVALPVGNRIIGGFGILIGVATMAMLASGLLILDLHGFLAVVASQTAWSVAVGVQLIRGRL